MAHLTLCLLFPFLSILYFLLPYVIDSLKLRQFPSPFPAALTNLWLVWHTRRGRRHHAVNDAHQKYGRFVRIAPNHVSIASPEALGVVYGHGNGFLKSEYYDAFVSIQRGIFNTRSRPEHTRKRKTVSHIFSTKSVSQFEPYMHTNIELFVSQWNKMCDSSPAGWARMNCLHWFNYLAFDIIADLTYALSYTPP